VGENKKQKKTWCLQDFGSHVKRLLSSAGYSSGVRRDDEQRDDEQRDEEQRDEEQRDEAQRDEEQRDEEQRDEE